MVRCVLIAATIFTAACSPRIDEEIYDRVQIGMSLEQVQSLLGPGEREVWGGYAIGPAGTLSGRSEDDARRQTWSWRDGDRMIIVDVFDGRVVAKRKSGF